MSGSENINSVLAPEEFEDLLDQWGAELAYWDPDKAAAARRLLAASEDARALLKRSQSFDHVLRQRTSLKASAEFRARILADAEVFAVPEKGEHDELSELVASLWPFGPVWRPAAGLIAAGFLGVIIGTTNLVQPADSVIAGAALTEEVISLAQLAGTDLEDVE